MLRFLTILVIVLFCLTAGATHIVGGEIFYRTVAPNTYEVTVLVYRDCGPANTNNQGFDKPSHLGVFQNGNLIRDIEMFDYTVKQLPVILTNPCLGLPPGICIEEARYVTTVILNSSPDDYILAWERCCRSPAIQNLMNARDYGLSLYATIPGTTKTSVSNTSAYFRNLMPLAFCLNDAVTFDHSAIDEDGDSLVYGLTAPYHGGDVNVPMPVPPNTPEFIKVPWNTGYSDTYPIDSDPAIKVDPLTGKLTLTTTKIGAFSFGVYVQEWRNGVLLSTNIRDFQFNVVNCNSDVQADIVPQSVYCNGTQFNFRNNSRNAKYYQWKFGSLTNPLDSSDLENPSYTFPDYGDYEVYMIANPGYPCADTVMRTYQIREFLDVRLDTQEVQCLTTNNFTLGVKGNFKPNADFEWVLPGGSTITSDQDSVLKGVSFNQVGWHVYQVTINNNDCQNILIDSVEVESPFIVADFTTSDTRCVGTTVSFFNHSEFTDYFYWDLAQAGSSELKDPVVQFPDTGSYVVVLTAGKSTDCLDRKTMVIDLKPYYQISLNMPDTVCLDSNRIDVVVLGTAVLPNFTLAWSPSGAGQISDLGGDDSTHSYHFSANGTKYIQATVYAYGCEKTALDSVVLVNNPDAEFIPSVADGCVPLSVSFKLVSSYPVKLDYEWSFGLDGSSKDAEPAFVYNKADTYYPKVRVVSQFGCLDTSIFELPAGIKVYPLPAVGFIVDKDLVPIDESTVKVSSTLGDNSRMYFKISDGYISNDSNFSHLLPDADVYRIWQYNESEHGCLDTLEKLVSVDGYTVYVPNAFTPDEDGYNDEFVPVISNCKQYEFRIFDRWGMEIFQSKRRGESWKGYFKGKPSPIGVYNYVLSLTDFQDRKHEFKGMITLVR